eukprot:865643_1
MPLRKDSAFSFLHQKEVLQRAISIELGRLGTSNITLILDPDVSPTISATVKMSFLSQLGVNEKQSFPVFVLNPADPAPLGTANKHVVYVTRGARLALRSMCVQVDRTRALANGKSTDFSCWMVPRISPESEEVIERHGLFGIIRLVSLELDLVPIEPDVGSLEISNSFRDLYLFGNEQILLDIAKSLLNLQLNFGAIQEIGKEPLRSVSVIYYRNYPNKIQRKLRVNVRAFGALFCLIGHSTH